MASPRAPQNSLQFGRFAPVGDFAGRRCTPHEPSCLPFPAENLGCEREVRNWHKPEFAELFAIRSLPGDNRTFSNLGENTATVQHPATHPIRSTLRSFTTSGFTQPGRAAPAALFGRLHPAP